MKEVTFCITSDEKIAFQICDTAVTVTIDPQVWMRRQDHTREMTRLQEFVDRQCKRLQAALETNESYAEKILSLRKELSATKDTAQNLSDENERLVLDLYGANGRLGDAKGEIEQLQKNLAETEAALDDKIACLEDSRLTATDLGQKLAEARHEIKRLEGLEVSRIGRIKELEDELKEYRNEDNALDKLIVNLRDKEDTISNQIDAIKSLNKNLASARHEINRLNIVNEKRYQSLCESSRLVSENQDLRSYIKLLEGSIGTLAAKAGFRLESKPE